MTKTKRDLIRGSVFTTTMIVALYVYSFIA